MEADLVNAFVEKQRDTINEYVAKNIMVEARLVVLEKKLQQAADLSDKIANSELQLKLMKTQNETMSVLIEKLNQKEKEAKEKANQLQEKNEQLQKLVDQLTNEKEAHRQKAEALRKKAEEIMSDNG